MSSFGKSIPIAHLGSEYKPGDELDWTPDEELVETFRPEFERMKASMAELGEDVAADHIAKRNAWYAKCAEDPQAQAEMYINQCMIFMTADSNSDDLLLEDEYCVYHEAMLTSAKNRFGSMPDYNEESAKEIYALYNSLNPDIDGISKEDFRKT